MAGNGTDTAAAGSVISLPKGGGAIGGMGETFSPDLFTGSGSFSVPIAVPHGRHGVQPELALAYSTGAGNGPFGLGWRLSLAGVTRKTSRGVPRYLDGDVFLLSGAEDLVPVAGTYPGRVRYRPRTEGLFARIERVRDGVDDYWEVRSKDGSRTRYGTPRPVDAPAGWRDPAVVADPADVGRVFGWQITETADTFGNLIRYEYGRDAGQEPGHVWDQPLLSRISYADYGDPAARSFLVTVDFDYSARPDPFSEHRAGFEVRSSLRCDTIRVSTHAADGVDRVAREYRLTYQAAGFNGVSLLTSVTTVGVDGAAVEAMPPVTFEYAGFDPTGRRFERVSGPPLPALTGPTLTLVDLRGIGLPDVVELGAAHRFWRNAGGGRFELPRTLSQAPPFALGSPGVQLMDADGDGRPDLMVTPVGSAAGFFPMSFGGGWSARSFQAYRQLPGVNLADASVKLVDLDGDGLTDVLRSGARLAAWFNDADPRQAWRRSVVSDAGGPAVDLADPAVRLADMTGDGLSDIVLLRSGNIAYWPNLGHGRWGAKVTMRDAPRLPDGFDPRRLLLGDVDGDGAADLVYVDDGRVTLWGNQSGNGWTRQPLVVTGTPSVVDTDGIQLADLHGSGMGGLLFSRDTVAWFLDFTGGVKPHLLTVLDNHLGARTTVRYRPSTQEYLRDAADPATRWRTTLPFPVHVVSRVEIEDEISGGRLSVDYRYHHGYWDGVEREFRGFGMVEHLDAETFTDDPETHSPPTLTKTWFHLGPVAVADSGDWTELDLHNEYWPGDPSRLSRPDDVTAFLAGLGRADRRSALRAMRGEVLRTELYALDGTDRATRPYGVTETMPAVREESPPAAGEFGRTRVFFPFTVGERSSEWERGDEPMTHFDFPIGYDAYGVPTSHLSVAVPRVAGQPYLSTYTVNEFARRDDADHYLVDKVARDWSYQVVNDGGLTVAELLAAVLAGPPVVADDPPGGDGGGGDGGGGGGDGSGGPAGGGDGPGGPADGGDGPGGPAGGDAPTAVFAVIGRAAAVPAATPAVSLRLLGHSRTFYDGDAFEGLALGTLGEHGLPVRQESIALTDGFLRSLFGATLPPYLDPAGPRWTAEYPDGFRTATPPLAGYRHYADADVPGSPGGYYVTVARHRYDVQVAGVVARGNLLASLDPLGAESRIAYDQHDLLAVQTTDPAGLVTTATYDYRVLQTRETTDVNGNSITVEFSPAALVTARFARGKHGEGDQRSPGTEMAYDLLAFHQRRQPVSVRTTRRTAHDGDETVVSVEYSDGFGRLLQTRAQADDVLFGDPTFGTGVIPAADLAPVRDTTGRPGTANVIVSGWQVYNNKGWVIAKYEPFFATGFDYAQPAEAQLGQRTRIFYEPRGHAVRTVHPDGSEERVVLGIPADLATPDVYTPTPWETYTYDANDNAGRTHGEAAGAYRDHWNTPASSEVDALGRTVRSVARNGAELITTVSAYDIHGNLLSVTDPLGRVAFAFRYDISHRLWRTDGMDTGQHGGVLDALGMSVESRDAKGALTLGTFDLLRRTSRVWARDDASGAVTLRQILEYGDAGSPDQPAADRAAAREQNLLGTVVRHHDEAGLVTVTAVDFKGNALESARRVIADAPILATYTAAAANGWKVAPFHVDWTPAAGQTQDARDAQLLEPAGYATSTSYDALNRVTGHTLPADAQGHRARLTPTYGRSGTLASVNLDGTVYVQRVAHDAKGGRTLVAYGNGVMTRYAYDPHTFRLARMRSEHYTLDALTYHPTGAAIEDRGYDYDLAGNVLTIRERAPGSGIPNNPDALTATDPVLRGLLGSGDALDRRFTYDPIYRLLSASGREHQTPPAGDPWSDVPRGTDATRAQAYRETYGYDAAENLRQLTHAGTGGFARTFTLAAGGNRLDRATVGSTVYAYAFDPAGNLISETSSRHFDWDHANRLAAFATQVTGGEPSVHAQYLYDSSGQRVKKLVRRQGGLVEVTHYLDQVFEHHRWAGAENNHVHVMEAHQRVALVRVGPAHPDDQGPAVAFHLSDHLGSSTAVVDDTGTLTNREEYSPYGETTFGSFARKRYRYTAQERDEESGLSHHGARYALLWLGRWASCDPAGMAGGLNQYLYAAANPMGLHDKGGTDPKPAQTEGADKKNLGATAIGAGIIDRHPKGRTLAVPNNFDRAKIKAYNQRIKDPFDRAVGIRSVQPGGRSRTKDIRRANDHKVREFVRKNGPRPTGTEVDHTVELQHIIRPNRAAPGANTVRNKDHRFQDKSINGSQGASARQEDLREIARGAPEDVPAGGVARVRDLNKIRNTQGYRTAARAFGVYSTAGGTYAALKGVGEDIRGGNFGSAALGASAYLGGASQLGAVAHLAITGSQSTLLLNGARFLGAPAAVAGAGVVGVQIGTHLYKNYVNKENSMDAGAWVEAKTGSRVAGGVAAAGWAIGSAGYHAPGAAVDYAKNTWTVHPSEVDWDRTLKPWKWF